ncbi:MAG: glycosyltransferase family 4 protein [Planctomycetota bacterium]
MAVDNLKVIFAHGSLCLGGAEVLRLSILEELVDRQADVEVVVLRKEGELAESVRQLGVPLTVLNNKGGLFDFAGVKKLAQFIRQKKPDIVQSSQFLTNLHTSLASRKAKFKNHIIEEHGIYTWKKWHHKFLDRTFNAKAKGVTACSFEVAKSAATHLAIPIENVTVIHNCVAKNHLAGPALNESERMQFRQQLTKYDRPNRLVGIVGTLRWEKGHQTLLTAWKQLYEKGTIQDDDFLVIVGDGPLRTELETMAASLPNVRFLGSIRETKPVLESLDLFVLPSHNEGFGIAIIEAMAAGIPVVASNSGGIPEIIRDETVGTLVPVANASKLANAVEKLLENPEFALQVGKTAKTVVIEQFSPANYVDQLENLWRRVV